VTRWAARRPAPPQTACTFRSSTPKRSLLDSPARSHCAPGRSNLNWTRPEAGRSRSRPAALTPGTPVRSVCIDPKARRGRGTTSALQPFPFQTRFSPGPAARRWLCGGVSPRRRCLTPARSTPCCAAVSPQSKRQRFRFAASLASGPNSWRPRGMVLRPLRRPRAMSRCLDSGSPPRPAAVRRSHAARPVRAKPSSRSKGLWSVPNLTTTARAPRTTGASGYGGRGALDRGRI